MSRNTAANFRFASKSIPAAISLLVLSLHAQAQTAPLSAEPQPAPTTKAAAKTDAKAAADSAQQTAPMPVVNVVSERQTNRVDASTADTTVRPQQ